MMYEGKRRLPFRLRAIGWVAALWGVAAAAFPADAATAGESWNGNTWSNADWNAPHWSRDEDTSPLDGERQWINFADRSLTDPQFIPTWGKDGIEPADTPQKTASVIQIMIMLTVIALAPSILVMLTSFLRIVIVMGFIRKALSTQTLPPDQILVGLSLLMTCFIMWPTWQQSWNNGWMPYWRGDVVTLENGETGRMDQKEAFKRILGPHRDFMFACLESNEGHEELFFFIGLYEGKDFTQEQAAEWTYADVDTVALIPAFITSELRRAFWMGFMLYLPFLILDMVIASVLMSMGMMMLQPAMISLPFKLVLFVVIDGWRLLMEGLVSSFPDEVYRTALAAGAG